MPLIFYNKYLTYSISVLFGGVALSQKLQTFYLCNFSYVKKKKKAPKSNIIAVK